MVATDEARAPNGWGVGVFWSPKLPAVQSLEVVAFPTHAEAQRFYLVVCLRFLAIPSQPMGPGTRPKESGL